jgi:hypothetical protein
LITNDLAGLFLALGVAFVLWKIYGRIKIDRVFIFCYLCALLAIPVLIVLRDGEFNLLRWLATGVVIGPFLKLTLDVSDVIVRRRKRRRRKKEKAVKSLEEMTENSEKPR